MTTRTYVRLAGVFSDDGEEREFAARALSLELAGGRLYELDGSRRVRELTVEADGALIWLGDGAAFSPDVGELARAGLL